MPYIILDLFGSILSLLSTYYVIKINYKFWLISSLSIFLNIVLFWNKCIYADMMVEILYLLINIYGLYMWTITNKNNKYAIKQLSKKELFVFIIYTIIFCILIFLLLKQWVHTKIAILDASTSSISLLAQWLMCNKIITSWIFWFISDMIYFYLYLYKTLPFHCILMIVYMVLSIIGYYRWSKEIST